MNRIYVVFLVLIMAWSCRKDDGGGVGDGVVVVPPKLLTEVAVEDDAEIKAYLETHFYNYEEFDSPSVDFDFKIKFDTIAGDNAGKTSMISQVQTQSITVASSIFGKTDDEEAQHILYYLVANVGVGGSPTIGDNAVVQYEGSLFNGVLFDAHSTPLNQYLSGGLIMGYANGIEKFNAGMGPVENGDGTVSYENYGVGAIFIPSGLGYFNGPPQGSGIPAYAPLIFKIDLLSFEKDTDFDGDGIPSIQEDLNGDGNLNNDNTDGDSEPRSIFLANHNDADDDNDGILTIDEIKMPDGTIHKDANGLIIFPDTDGDGIPDHLDNDNN